MKKKYVITGIAIVCIIFWMFLLNYQAKTETIKTNTNLEFNQEIALNIIKTIDSSSEDLYVRLGLINDIIELKTNEYTKIIITKDVKDGLEILLDYQIELLKELEEKSNE